MAVVDQLVTDAFAIYHGDACEVLPRIPDESVGLSIFSPPFADLYTYSDSERDLGNSQSYAQFFEHFEFIARELLRLLKPGRSICVHCMELPATIVREGYIGLRDFPGDVLRLFEKCGFIYHSRVVIWKDPLIAAVRTKALGLAHKTLVKDSSMCRAGLPDYVLTFRKAGGNPEPIAHLPEGLRIYIGGDDPGGEGVKRSHNIWRRYASPVWMDIRQSRVLPFREARDEDDQKHICPLQLDVIERCLVLWSNPGDVVLTPFMGVGSEVYGAVRAGRKGLGIELKGSYYRQARANVESAVRDSQAGLFEVRP
ncbi:MAG: DNA-methyltransferase [Dehalococcoidia bacterium]